MPRSIRMPTRPGDDEGERHRDRPANSRTVPDSSRAHHLLHHEGRVGAEHHHLAMRHVDDAHDAEGDGEPDGGEQQHRAERKPVPGVLHRAPERELALTSRRRRGRGRGRPTGRRLGRQRRTAAPPRPGRRGRGSPRRRRSCRPRWRRRVEHDGGARLGQRPFDARRWSPWRWRPRAPAARSSSRDLNTAWAASSRLCRIGRPSASGRRARRRSRAAAGC